MIHPLLKAKVMLCWRACLHLAGREFMRCFEEAAIKSSGIAPFYNWGLLIENHVSRFIFPGIWNQMKSTLTSSLAFTKNKLRPSMKIEFDHLSSLLQRELRFEPWVGDSMKHSSDSANHISDCRQESSCLHWEACDMKTHSARLVCRRWDPGRQVVWI